MGMQKTRERGPRKEPLDLNMERNKKAQKLIRCDRGDRKKRTDLGVFKGQMSPLSSVHSTSIVGHWGGF